MATLPESRLRLRTMAAPDLESVHILAQAEQWPQRRQDLADMLALGDGLAAEIAGKIVGAAMWWPCGPHAATLGMMVVARSHRGGGIGRLVLESALERLGDRSVYVNATADAVPLYRKLGFRGIADIIQHQGAAFMAPLVPLDAGERIRPLGTSDEELVTALAEAATGLPRTAVMAAILEEGHGIVLDRAGEVTGFAIFRRSGRGYAIGPVVAPDLVRAKALIAQWLGARSGEFTRLDVGGVTGLSAWLEALGIVRVGQVVTMVRGPELAQALPGRSFAIAGEALG